MSQFAAQAFLHTGFHICEQIHRSDKIHHQAISSHLGKLVFACQRLALFIQNRQHQIGGTQVNANF
jgi:hypothetical protein